MCWSIYTASLNASRRKEPRLRRGSRRFSHSLLRAARAQAPDRDTELPGLVGEVLLDAGAGADDDTDRQDLQDLVVALEGCRLGMARPVRLERDVRHLAIV